MMPIYQMTLGVSPNNEIGLIFSSEIDEDFIQSPVFVLPVPRSISDPFELYGYVSEEEFYFPGILGEEEIDAESSADMPFISFHVPNTDISARFELKYLHRKLWISRERSFFDMPMLMPYVGLESDAGMAAYQFTPLMPVDLVELDDLYRTSSFAFVGLTPQFGRRRQ